MKTKIYPTQIRRALKRHSRKLARTRATIEINPETLDPSTNGRAARRYVRAAKQGRAPWLRAESWVGNNGGWDHFHPDPQRRTISYC